MKENDIRPEVYAADHRVVVLQDVGRLLTRRDEFVEVCCPACESGPRSAKWVKFGLNYWECDDCQTVYISPRPSPSVLEWFYHGSVNYAYWNKYIFPASESARRERIFVPRVNRFLDLCAKHHVATSAVLEVGAAFGTFCQELKSRNVFDRIVAIEPTPDLAQHCRLKGIEVIERPFEGMAFGEKDTFDAMVSFEVIEHLFSPGDFFRRAKSLLAENGLLMVTCPNVNGFDITTLGQVSDSVDAEHLNYFNPAALSALLARCGLEVLEVQTPGELDAELVRKKVLNGEFSLDSQPWLQRVLLDQWERVGAAFQAFLSESQLSSHMWIVARKRG